MTAIRDLHERLDAIEAKLDAQQAMLSRIHKVLDTAFSRFGDIVKSPMLAAMFGSAVANKEKTPVNE